MLRSGICRLTRDPLPPKPKKPPQEEIEELKKVYNEKRTEYFTPEFKARFSDLFKLFSRTNADYCNFEELLDLLVCSNSCYDSEEELVSLYEVLAVPNLGITEHQVYLLLTKKKKDNDKKSDLVEAFQSLPIDEDMKMDSEKFMQLLMDMGYKYTEEQAAIVLKEADPKNTGKVDANAFIENIMMLEKKKPKKSKPKAK